MICERSSGSIQLNTENILDCSMLRYNILSVKKMIQEELRVNFQEDYDAISRDDEVKGRANSLSSLERLIKTLMMIL